MTRRAAVGRRRRSEKVVLPTLRNPARCAVESNQREADAVEHEWDDPHRRLRRRRRQLEPLAPQLAYVYLPSVFPFIEHRYETRRHSRSRATKPLRKQHCQRNYDTSSGDGSSCSSSDEDDNTPMPQKKTTMRGQRMQSLANMSKLQNDAATMIQSEYRFYRRRQTNRNRRNHRLAIQAQTFLDVFLLREMTSLVPVCLLEVLRETRAQEAASVKLKKDFAASLANGILVPLIDESIRDVFHDVLQASVKSYLAQQFSFSSAATPMAITMATDILDNWIQELVENLLPEVLVELASEYTVHQQYEVVWETLLQDEIQSVALGTVETKTRSASLTKDEGTN